MKFKWETISADIGENCLYETARAKVIGGWVIKNLSLFGMEEGGTEEELWRRSSESLVFISDPNHEWVIEKNQKSVTGSSITCSME